MLRDPPHLAGQIYLIDGFNGSTLGLKAVWERDLKIAFVDDEWNKVIQFKILNRLYWMPVRMKRAGLSNSNICWQCYVEQGDVVHMFFNCPSLAIYWLRIMETISNSLGIRWYQCYP